MGGAFKEVKWRICNLLHTNFNLSPGKLLFVFSQHGCLQFHQVFTEKFPALSKHILQSWSFCLSVIKDKSASKMWEIVKRGICDVFFCIAIMKKFCVIVMWLQSINSTCAVHRFKLLFLLNLQLFKRKKIMQVLGKDGENVFVGFEGESAKMLYRRQFWEVQKMFSVVTSGYKIQIRLILMLVAVIHHILELPDLQIHSSQKSDSDRWLTHNS